MMARYGVLIWLFYLLVVLAGGFALFEGLALREPTGLTLSRFVYNTQQAWPLLGPLIGIGIGILLCHFFWHWDPKAQARIKELEAENAELRKR